ncbi:MAG: hypothetical protein OXU20_22165 [Myxococcales bacterium]|nr:hypothetical protein [Myxococcales bacterium]
MMKISEMRRWQWGLLCCFVLGCGKARTYPELEQLISDRAAAEATDAGADASMATYPATVDGCDPDMLGLPCAKGLGACARSGETVCEDGEVVCPAEPGAARKELCASESDEDCDGEVDEAPEGMCCVHNECGEGEVCERLPPEVDAAKPGECVALGGEAGGACDAELQTDNNNCGTCGNACGAGESCFEGACVQDPAPPCGGADFNSDRDNCGLCGLVCEEGEVCEDRRCVVECDAELDTDPANCGVCGRECDMGLECIAGECTAPEIEGVSCPDGQAACGMQCIPASDCCGDPDCTSRAPFCRNGDCIQCRGGEDCDSDEICEDGACKPRPVPCGGACEPAEQCIDDNCVCPGDPDTDTDRRNCGTCGNRCRTSQVCKSGTCVAKPECASAADCPATSFCGHATCSDGRCGIEYAEQGTPCPDGGYCNGLGAFSVCVECLRDDHCPGGACGAWNMCAECRNNGHCDAGETCQDGKCERDALACPGGRSPTPEVCDASYVDEDCDGTANEDCECVDGQTSICGNAKGICAPGGTKTCVQGTWGACKGRVAPRSETCNGRDDDCDGKTDEETDLQNDPQNCGKCGHVCDGSEEACDISRNCCPLTVCSSGNCTWDAWKCIP